MANVDLWVTLNDLQGWMQKKLTQGGLSLVDFPNFVKNSELIWLSLKIVSGGLGGYLKFLTEDLKDWVIFDIWDHLGW